MAAADGSSTERDRERTMATLVEAVGGVIDARGVLGLGVNAVAKEAGVDKVLIYRYFGGLDGLVDAFAQSSNFWPSAEEILDERATLLAMPFADRLELIFRRYVNALRARPRTLAILRSEMLDHSPLYRPLEGVREQMGLKLLQIAAADAPRGLDVPALATLFTAAIHYLLIRSRFINQFNGLRLDSDEGWERILTLVRPLITALDAQCSAEAQA